MNTLQTAEAYLLEQVLRANSSRKLWLEHIQAFPIPGGIPKSRKQCESSVVGGDGGRPWRELTARICVIV